MRDTLNIWRSQSHNHVNGPGCRFVLWVQGCHLGCEGCWNKHTWSFARKNIVTVDSIFDLISSTKGIDGVTFTGGEPFVQAKSLSVLARRIKEQAMLNIQIFTGFELNELKNKHQKDLLSLADVVVAGRFDATKKNNNQKVYEHGSIKWPFNNSDVEVEIDKRGDVIITGYPPNELIDRIKEAVQ